MEPTLHTNQYLLVNKVSYMVGEPKRGDVVVLRFPQDPRGRDYLLRFDEDVEILGFAINAGVLVYRIGPADYVADPACVERRQSPLVFFSLFLRNPEIPVGDRPSLLPGQVFMVLGSGGRVFTFYHAFLGKSYP